jgi:hypothetical protein
MVSVGYALGGLLIQRVFTLETVLAAAAGRYVPSSTAVVLCFYLETLLAAAPGRYVLVRLLSYAHKIVLNF